VAGFLIDVFWLIHRFRDLFPKHRAESLPQAMHRDFHRALRHTEALSRLGHRADGFAAWQKLGELTEHAALARALMLRSQAFQRAFDERVSPTALKEFFSIAFDGGFEAVTLFWLQTIERKDNGARRV